MVNADWAIWVRSGRRSQPQAVCRRLPTLVEGRWRIARRPRSSVAYLIGSIGGNHAGSSFRWRRCCLRRSCWRRRRPQAQRVARRPRRRRLHQQLQTVASARWGVDLATRDLASSRATISSAMPAANGSTPTQSRPTSRRTASARSSTTATRSSCGRSSPARRRTASSARFTRAGWTKRGSSSSTRRRSRPTSTGSRRSTPRPSSRASWPTRRATSAAPCSASASSAIRPIRR